MWCRRITERGAPAVAYLGCKAQPAGAFGDVDAAIVSEDLRARWQAARRGDLAEDQVADSVRHVTAAVANVEEQLADGRDWLMGAFSIADSETFGWLRGAGELVPDAFAGKDQTTAWLARMEARPSVQAALARAGRSDPEHAWAVGPEINRWG